MRRILVIMGIAVIYYFTMFRMLYNMFQDNLIIFLFSNLIAFAFIYQWFKGQLYQL